jgi:hypothetical protein
MPFRTDDLQKAYLAYKEFSDHNPPKHHKRYIFPFFAGSYFTFRKIDVRRVFAIAKSISPDPNYIDIGCGYGDFLSRIRQIIPGAIGIEQDASIFYMFQKPKPDYIYSSATAADWFGKRSFDVSFVGWMEPGVDFRKAVSQFSKCIITTFDAGGQCGINGECEYEEFGFQKIAWWRTPSWIDVNCELMNRFYTSSLRTEKNKKEELAKLRTAHNLWYIYTRPEISSRVSEGLECWLKKEEHDHLDARQSFDFESLLDECGFHYMETLAALLSEGNQLWKVIFE